MNIQFAYKLLRVAWYLELSLYEIVLLFLLECTAGFYGDQCASSCGRCQDDSACQHVTGACDNGCQPGYQEPDCNKGRLFQ